MLKILTYFSGAPTKGKCLEEGCSTEERSGVGTFTNYQEDNQQQQPDENKDPDEPKKGCGKKRREKARKKRRKAEERFKSKGWKIFRRG